MDDIPILPVIYATRMVEMMREEGIDTDSVLRESGVNPNLMSRPDSLLTMRQAHSLIRRFMGLSSRNLPALRYGLRLDLISHGLLGHVYFWQGEFRELIVSIVDYLRVRLPLVCMELSQGQDYFGIRLSSRLPKDLQDMEAFIIQTYMASLRTLGGAVIRNIAIHCRHDLFADVSAAQSLLKLDINNDHDCNEIRFYLAGVKLETKPAELIDAAGETTARNHPKDPYNEHGFVVRLRAQLLSHMRGDQSAEAIASAMGMSVRTLRRRLDDCEMSFNKIRLDVRMQVATRYLTTTGISIERIADYVGYSDQASFTRAFREWGGETPNTVRQRRISSLQDGETGELPVKKGAADAPPAAE